MAKKEEKRTDILAQAEGATGIPYQTIIHSICKDMGLPLNEADEIVYTYEAGRKVPQKINDFALFLLKEWEKENDKNPLK